MSVDIPQGVQGARILVPTEARRMQLKLEVQLVVRQYVVAARIEPSFSGRVAIVLNCEPSFKQPSVSF